MLLKGDMLLEWYVVKCGYIVGGGRHVAGGCMLLEGGGAYSVSDHIINILII